MAEIKEEEKKLASEWQQKFKDAMSAKENITANWMNYLNAWNNSLYEEASSASYKSNQVSNYIYSTIESMRPIMFDNHPKFEVVPVNAQALAYIGDINRALDWEWHRSGMQRIMIANSIYTFVMGTSVLMLPWQVSNKPNEDVDGNVTPIPVNPFNLFPDPLATNVDDAEYIIYASYQHVNLLKREFPDKADNLTGADIQYSELVNNRNEGARIKNQVLVLEVWCRDYTTIDVEEETTGKTKTKSAYPTGRVITVAPELSLILKDEPNPYRSGRFPFFLFKDIDVPFQFWGEGEVKWLLSPQEYINDLSNQIIDNARHTANQIWVIDKNAGIPQGSLTNRPGLVIRKNPGTTVERPSPPSMPMYVTEKILQLQKDIEIISGVHDVTRGQNPGGIESGTAILALQEAAQTRVRLKIQLHELTLGEVGTEWLDRMQQFWKSDRTVPIQAPLQSTQLMAQATGQPAMPQDPMQQQPQVPGQPVQQGQATQYDFITISSDKLGQKYMVKVIGGSTQQLNSQAMLQLMIQLAQTPAEDGMPIVNRETVLDFLPKVNKEQVLNHFGMLQQQQMQMQQQQMLSQDGMSQIQGILGGMNQQMQGMNSDITGVKQRFAKQDEDEANGKLIGQGYDQGMQEAMAMQQTQQTAGEIPPELMQQMQNMSDQELGAFLQSNPELADRLK